PGGGTAPRHGAVPWPGPPRASGLRAGNPLRPAFPRPLLACARASAVQAMKLAVVVRPWVLVLNLKGSLLGPVRFKNYSGQEGSRDRSFLVPSASPASSGSPVSRASTGASSPSSPVPFCCSLANAASLACSNWATSAL